MTKKLIGTMLLAGSALFAAPHFSIGIGVGAPAYAPPAYAAVQPPMPGPGYTWVDGYWGPDGTWVAGYWAPPDYYAAPAYGGPAYGAPVYAPAYPVYRHDRDWDHDRYRFRRGDRDHERDEHHDFGRGRGDGFRR